MQGFNMGRYVPPDAEGLATGNQIHKKRAQPSSHGAPVVRFEMPFAVWCGSCPRPTLIAQGVRFNAEKRRVGAYFSTPIWSFIMRHADCGGRLEVRTDPKNTTYVVVAGGTAAAHQNHPQPEAAAPILTDHERDELRANAFASLERTIDDRQRLCRASDRIDGLLAASARHWDDPYAKNQRLRRSFRAARKQREREGAADDDLRDRMSISIDLVPESKEDATRASLVHFGAAPDDDDDDGVAPSAARTALGKPLFGSAKSDKEEDKKNRTTKNRKENQIEKEYDGGRQRSDVTGEDLGALKKTMSKECIRIKKHALMSTVLSNTRIQMDPFLQHASKSGEAKRSRARLAGVKRGRGVPPDPRPPPLAAPNGTLPSQGLVNYDSD